MKEIQLTKGKVALVDDCEFAFLSQFHWAAWHHKSGSFYARTTIRREGRCKWLLMHRLLVSATLSEKVDRWNHNTLDNQRQNLRVCTQVENLANSRLSLVNTSGFKGVALDDRDGAWFAYIGSRQSREYLGRFQSPEDAARAYDIAALERWGAFARTNASLGLLQ